MSASEEGAWSDRDLVLRMRQHDVRALRQFFVRFRVALRGEARRLRIQPALREEVVEDCLADVMMGLIDREDEPPSSLAPYLLRALRNQISMARRTGESEARRDNAATSDAHAIGERAVLTVCSRATLRASAGAGEDDPAIDPVLHRLAKVLNRTLSKEERQLLKWLGEWVSQPVIAAWIGISFGAARVRIHRLRGRLRALTDEWMLTLDDHERREVERVGGTQTSTASTSVTVASSVTAIVVVDTVNPGEAFERDLCLTINVGPAAAYECGDLRIVHGLPAVRTMNTRRSPTLLYNSQFAQPAPLVAANVTMPAGSLASTVQALVTVGGQTYGTTTWPGSDWGSAGMTRRIAIALTQSLPTGIHDYTLKITFAYADGSQSPYTVSGRLAVVDRQASSFGAGWWLAGLEQLNPSTMVWVGGDGSVRQYRTVNTNGWTSASLTEPDTLKWDGTYYVRYLTHGLKVKFNAAGQHVQTVNRLEHVTTFAYDGAGRLSSITVPTPGSGTGPVSASPALLVKYQFLYDANGKLQYVTAPGVNGDRVTTLVVSNGTVQSIKDPDSDSVSFGYRPASGEPYRIFSRTDRRGKMTAFDYDAGKRLMRSARSPGGGADSVVLSLTAAETRGLAGTVSASAQLLSDVFTRIDGPRTDVVDVTKTWVNRFGAPTLIENALGGQTAITYGDSRWPALATRLQYPNGRVLATAYGSRGSVAHTTDLSWVQNGQAATTRYQWDSKWDAVTMIRTPTGVTTRLTYDAATGNRISQEDGRGSMSQVQFRYYADPRSYGLLRAIQSTGGMLDSVVYDGGTQLGNVSATRAASGAWTYFTNDAIGRATIARHPIDVAATAFQSDSLTYDRSDQVTRSVNYGPALGTQSAQKVVVNTFYNAEGQVDSLTRSSEPDTNHIGVIKTVWRYDEIGRTVAEVAPDGVVDSSDYNPAGQVVRQYTRRGHLLSTEYDALGRVIKRMVPDARYCSRDAGIPPRRRAIGLSGTEPYPLYVTNDCGGLTVPADVAVFTYDSVGNLLTADNRDARVKRSYYSNGLLKTDSLRIRIVAEDTTATGFSVHKYGLEYLYDLDGRRTDLLHPSQLRGGTTRDRTSYGYHPQMGALQTVTDLMSNVFSYGYDSAGRVNSLTLPGGVGETYAYDAGGRLGVHMVRNQSTSVNFRSTDFQYDARDKVTRTANIYGTRDTLTAGYSPLGHLTSSWFRSRGATSNGSELIYTVSENYNYDALANFQHSIDTTQQQGIVTSTRQRNQGYVPQVGRLAYESSSGIRDTFYYDAAGNTEFTTQAIENAGPFADRASYYGADGMLRVADRRTDSGGEIGASYTTAFEEYRYDALGRRVLVRVRRWCQNDPQGLNGECRLSKIKRIVWDGSQELYEIQMPGEEGSALLESDTDTVRMASVTNTAKFDPNPFFGRVAYTHGAALDQPLSVIRSGYGDLIDEQNIERPHRVLPPFAIMPLWAANGQADNGVFADGGVRKCETIGGVTRCVYIQWPAYFYAYARQNVRRSAWHGSLVEDKRDGSGTFYRRNRQYDPATGRFTQEDPIGLAGGMNLYGFASGDPVNYSDPFGLSACTDKHRTGLWCKVGWWIHDFIVGPDGDPNDPSGRLASPAALDPVAIGSGMAAGAIVGMAEGAAGAEISTSVHGALRMSDPSRLGIQGVRDAITDATRLFTQKDGAQVFAQEVGGKFNVVVVGRRGVVTTFKNLSTKSLDRLSKNFGWVPK